MDVGGIRMVGAGLDLVALLFDDFRDLYIYCACID